MNDSIESSSTTVSGSQNSLRGFPVARCGIAGVLMGLANLVPGISGGTMVLIMGLYEEFITAVADATRLRFTRRGVLLLAILGMLAIGTIAAMSGTLARLVETQPALMYGLFIGMTLGGAPLLIRMAAPWKPGTWVAVAAGIALMFGITAMGGDVKRPTDEEKKAQKERIARGEFDLKVMYGRDVAAGIIGMSAMVLPGISGAYMLLIMGRYEQILAAISLGKTYLLTMGKEGDPTAFKIIIPVGIGVIISLVLVSNLLKWLLRHHEKPTVGFLLGIVLGSAATLPISKADDFGGAWGICAAMIIIGFAATVMLERVAGVKGESHPSERAAAD